MKIASPIRVAATVVASAAAWAPLPALSATASTSLTNITLSAVDLDPLDGITAGFSFVPAGSSLDAGFFVENLGRGLRDNETSLQSELDSPLISTSFLASVVGAQATGSSTSSGIVLSGSTTARETTAFGRYNLSMNLLLTPATELQVHADYSIDGTIINACDSRNCEQAAGNVGLIVRTEGGDHATASFSAFVRRDGSVVSSPPQTGELGVQFKNLSGDSTNVLVELGANVSVVGAVPEPETYALMLLGIGTLGIATRRARRWSANASRR